MDTKTPSAALLLNHYAALEFASEEMLAAAQNGHWDTVARLEAACSIVIIRLRGMGEGVDLTEAQHLERTRILRTLMENDLKICEICNDTPMRFDAMSFPETPARNMLLH